jgi:CheY-like chemotaxis protein
VRLAASGMEALDQIRRARPDIVLCDIGMPQMDGFELLRRIRSMDDPATRRLPVLAVSAYASEDYRMRSLRAGFQGHVAKPFNPFDLVQTVADVLTRV